MMFKGHFDDFGWNGWAVSRVFNWFVCKKKGKESIWFHQSEIPGALKFIKSRKRNVYIFARQLRKFMKQKLEA